MIIISAYRLNQHLKLVTTCDLDGKNYDIYASNSDEIIQIYVLESASTQPQSDYYEVSCYFQKSKKTNKVILVSSILNETKTKLLRKLLSR